MNANKQDAGGLLPCPFCGGEPIQYDYADGYGIHCGNVECTIDMFATSRDSDADARAIWNRRNGELCRAAPAGGDYRGVIPQVLDETINGVVSDLEMIAAGKDQVTGDPVSGLQSQRIAKAAHDRLLSAWNACDSAPAGSGEVDDEVMKIADFFEGVRVFVTSREKIKHPEGTDLFDEHVTRLLRVAALLRKLQQGADGVDWRAHYRFQTAMRYMDNNDKMTLDRAQRMADEDIVRMERAAMIAASQGQEGA